MNKVASNDHNWHIEDESNVELTGRYERSTAVQVIRMFLDLLVLSVDMLMPGDPTKKT